MRHTRQNSKYPVKKGHTNQNNRKKSRNSPWSPKGNSPWSSFVKSKIAIID
jgi:hypothetical protein